MSTVAFLRCLESFKTLIEAIELIKGSILDSTRIARQLPCNAAPTILWNG